MFDCLTTIWIKYTGRLVKSYILIILGCDPLVIKSCWFDIGKNKLVNLFLGKYKEQFYCEIICWVNSLLVTVTVKWYSGSFQNLCLVRMGNALA